MTEKSDTATSEERDGEWTAEPTRTRFWLVRKADGEVVASYLSERDARLIASAPRLAAVAARLIAWDADTHCTPGEYEALIEEAIAALSKARGTECDSA